MLLAIADTSSRILEASFRHETEPVSRLTLALHPLPLPEADLLALLLAELPQELQVQINIL
jgi:hypothetical protein